MRDDELKKLLEKHYELRNTEFELSLNKPDPLFAVRRDLHAPHIDEIAVVCALLAYGNAKQILATLLELKFRTLGDKGAILATKFPHYRFQTSNDIKMLFLALNEIIKNGGIRAIFVESYARAKSDSSSDSKTIESPVICGINAMIDALYLALQKKGVALTRGLEFLIGRKALNPRTSSPLKRWNLLLRWMTRRDNIDLGLWSAFVDKADLILPLDTHTFRLSQKLNLLQSKRYNLQSAIEISRNLARFCPQDPIKYDFALYRLGQEKIM